MTLSAPHRLEEVYSMSVQLALRFDEVTITCETQQRYHSITPCLAGRGSSSRSNADKSHSDTSIEPCALWRKMGDFKLGRAEIRVMSRFGHYTAKAHTCAISRRDVPTI